jgi:hypothetical protein
MYGTYLQSKIMSLNWVNIESTRVTLGTPNYHVLFFPSFRLIILFSPDASLRKTLAEENVSFF